MLQKMGEHIHGWIAGIFVVVIAVIFSLFGISYYLSGSTPATEVIAKVNGEKLLGQALQNKYTQAVSSDPTLAAASPQKRLAKKQQIVDNWVKQQAIATSLQKAGMLVSPNVVRSFVLSFPMFQVGGTFSQMLFSNIMQQQGYLNEQQAYEGLAKSLASTNFVSALENSAFVTPNLIKRYFQLLMQQRTFRYSLIQSSQFANKVTVTTEELKSYYQKNLANFKAPETVTVNYIMLSPKSVMPLVHIDASQVKQYYQNHMQNFSKPASWTFATFSESDLRSKYLKADNKKIKQMFKSQVANLKAGKNIPAFLKAHKPMTQTEDQLAQNKKLIKLLSALKPGAVSAVQTDNLLQGDTVYYLVSDTAKKVTPFAQAKKKIMDSLQQQQIKDILSAKNNQMTSLALSNPEGLSDVAKTMGLPIQTTKPFTRKGLKSGPAASTQFVAAAFGDFVLAQGMNSDPIILKDGSIVVMHLKKHTPAANKPFASVKSEVKQDYLQQQTMQLATAQAKQLATKLNNNQAVSLSWKAVTHAKLNDKSAPAAISKAVFDQPFAVGDKAASFVVPVNKQQVAVVQLQSIYIPSANSMTAKQKQSVESQMNMVRQQALLKMMQKSLTAHSDIKVYKDRIA